MTSHLLLMVIFALFVSIVFGTLMRDEPKEQLRFGAQLFAAFVVGGIALGWLLFTHYLFEVIPPSFLRTAELADLYADTVGVAIALIACWAWSIISPPRHGL